MAFATVGRSVRDPAIFPWLVPSNSAIIRGQAVVWDLSLLYARPATTGDTHIYAIALSDADTDELEVMLEAADACTLALTPVTGQTFVTGALVYFDIAGGTGKITNTSSGNLLYGYVVNGSPDAQGNYECARFWV